MSRKLPAITAKKLIKVLHKKGFARVRRSGSHAIFRHPDGRRTTVPIHSSKDLGIGLLKQIMKDTDILPEELR